MVFITVNVTAEDVRDILNITDKDITDVKVTKFLKNAEIALELETGNGIEYSSCTDHEAHFIKHLAAIYAICYLTGGSFVGLNFSLGDLNVSALQNIPSIEMLRAEVDRVLLALRGKILG